MNLKQYKKLADELITEINYYEMRKDYFKGVDDALNREQNNAMLGKIAGVITALTYSAMKDFQSKEPKHISEIMAEMNEIHPPMSVVDVNGKGELMSCVEIAEMVHANPHRKADSTTII